MMHIDCFWSGRRLTSITTTAPCQNRFDALIAEHTYAIRTRSSVRVWIKADSIGEPVFAEGKSHEGETRSILGEKSAKHLPSTSGFYCFAEVLLWKLCIPLKLLYTSTTNGNQVRHTSDYGLRLNETLSALCLQKNLWKAITKCCQLNTIKI